MTETIPALLLAAAAEAPDATALSFPGERVTWLQLARWADALAAQLHDAGVRPGDRVGVLMPNSPECVAAIGGVLLSGAMLVPVNTRYRAAELSHLVSDAELSVVLTSERTSDYADLPGLLAAALADVDADPAVIVVPPTPATLDGPDDSAERGRCRPHAPITPGDTAIVLYTSGTTAAPRGCLLSHAALVHAWTQTARVYEMTPRDRLWGPCPMFHLGGIGMILMCARHACTLISDAWFDAGRALRQIEDEAATVLYPAYPPITQGILSHPEFDAGRLPHARAICNVAPPETLRQMQAALPHVTQLSIYGLTEGAGPITYNRLHDDLRTRTTTCGPPLPGAQVRIVDPETGVAVAAETSGEIHIRGASLFAGYLNQTSSPFDADGWFATGDHGVLDATGRLRFLGRLKEMLKVGGENVAPAEVEARLALHPAVKLAQVVGVPDTRLDEVVAAFVELRPGARADADELIEHCRGAIASFKLPRHVRFVDEWPLSATKIQKGPLRDRLIAELRQAPDAA